VLRHEQKSRFDFFIRKFSKKYFEQKKHDHKLIITAAMIKAIEFTGNKNAVTRFVKEL